MELTEILTGVSIIATAIVGIILSRQIKSQKEIIEKYKGLVEATSPDKIIALHDREIDKIKTLMDSDIKELRTQVIEMGSYIDYDLNKMEEMAKSINQPEIFDRSARVGIINRQMPHCVAILDSIHTFRIASKE